MARTQKRGSESFIDRLSFLERKYELEQLEYYFLETCNFLKVHYGNQVSEINPQVSVNKRLKQISKFLLN